MDLYYIKDFLFYNEMDVFAYFQRKVLWHDFWKDSLFNFPQNLFRTMFKQTYENRRTWKCLNNRSKQVVL